MHGGLEQLLHAIGELSGSDADARVQAWEQPVVDPERDAAAAARGEDTLGRQRDRMGQRHLGAAVDGGHLEPCDLLARADDLLHPQVADDQLFERHRRAEQREELLAIDEDAERLLADDLARDLVHLPPLDPQIRAHLAAILATKRPRARPAPQ